MKTKHIILMVLALMASMTTTAQQVKWMNPMDGDIHWIATHIDRKSVV